MSDVNRIAGREVKHSATRNRTFEGDDRKRIVFVAPPGSISRALTCAIETEFPWLSVTSVTDPDRIADGPRREVHLIAMAYGIFCGLEDSLPELAERYSQAGLSIMVETMGHLSFRDLPEGLPLRGVLPMDVNLDIWLSILRVMLCGGTYLAPDSVMPGVFCGKNIHVDAPSPAPGPALRDGGFAPATKEDDLRPAGCRRATSALDALTVRECEVLHLVSRGCQNKIIAAELDLTENTVKIHLHNIIRKLAVTNRTQAAGLYLEEIEGGRQPAPLSAAQRVRLS